MCCSRLYPSCLPSCTAVLDVMGVQRIRDLNIMLVSNCMFSGHLVEILQRIGWLK